MDIDITRIGYFDLSSVLEKFDAKLVTDLIRAKNDYENSIVTNKLNFFRLKLFFLQMPVSCC